MKCVIYARVSKDDSTQNPDNQLKPLREWAKALEYDIVEEYVEHISGGNSNRPQFRRMLKQVRLGTFSVILVWSLDRFSREPMLDTLNYFKQLKENKIQITL